MFVQNPSNVKSKRAFFEQKAATSNTKPFQKKIGKFYEKPKVHEGQPSQIWSNVVKSVSELCLKTSVEVEDEAKFFEYSAAEASLASKFEDRPNVYKSRAVKSFSTLSETLETHKENPLGFENDTNSFENKVGIPKTSFTSNRALPEPSQENKVTSEGRNFYRSRIERSPPVKSTFLEVSQKGPVKVENGTFFEKKVGASEISLSSNYTLPESYQQKNTVFDEIPDFYKNAVIRSSTPLVETISFETHKRNTSDQTHADTDSTPKRNGYDDPLSAAEPEDSYLKFGYEVANKLRAMDAQQRNIAEKLIKDTLFYGKMRLLTIQADTQFASCMAPNPPPRMSSYDSVPSASSVSVANFQLDDEFDV